MNHGSLFSGIGGFDLAAEWMGWENVFHCEWNEFSQQILKYYWPKAISYEDITKTDFSIHRGKIDILTGGFPCQPYSSAGKRLGKEDDRHLWPEMLRAIREIQPRYIVGENVYGLTHWNGGLVFNEVQVDLENEGYKVQPILLPACAVGAPHRRDRVWFIAHSNDPRTDKPMRDKRERTETDKRQEGFTQPKLREARINEDAANSISKRLQRRQNFNEWEKHNKKRSRNGFKFRADSKDNEWRCREAFENFPTQPPICGGDDGLPSKLDGITFPKWRQESIKAYGNAIVPQVAYQIFKALMIAESKAWEEKNIITGDMHEPIQKTGT